MTEHIEHLKHMIAVRPNGPDKLAAAWAIAEIERLRATLTIECRYCNMLRKRALGDEQQEKM